jgi:hypothetical protein
VTADDSTVNQKRGLFRKRNRPKVVYYKPLNKHPLLFLVNWVRMQAYKFIFGAFIGVFAAAGLYWLLTQTNEPIHAWWHDTVPNDTVRHNDRALFEGVAGALIGFAVAWNHYKPKFYSRPKGLNKFLSKMGIPVPNDGHSIKTWQLFLAPALWIGGVAIALYVIVRIGQLFGYGLGDTASSTTVFAQTDPGFVGVLEKNINAFLGDLPVKIQGFVAGFAGRYLIQGIIDDVQLWFAEQRVSSGRKYNRLQWLVYPPAYLARYTETRRDVTVALKQRSAWASRLFKTGTITVVLFAILGFCAINFNLPHVQ